MTEQLRLPPGQDEHTIKMNAWFTASFDALMSPHIKAINTEFGDIAKAINENVDDTNAALDNIVEGEVGKAVSMQHKKISELLEIVQVLAVGNDFLCGRIDQIQREFKGLKREQAPKTIEPQQSKQDDSQDEDEFMEQCISNLEDQGVDDAENVCANLWQEQQEQRSSGIAKTLAIIDEVLHG
jgi:hypothetical protein